MYPASDPPIEAQAWQGWPVGWQVPSNLNSSSVAARVSTVFSCIDLNARIAGTLPVYVKIGNVRRDPQPEWITNPASGLYTGWTDMLEQAWWTYQRRGEIIFWALSRYADGSVRNFAVLNPDMVDVERGPDGYPVYTLMTWNDELGESAGVIRLDRADVLHITYAKWPGELRGHSPLESVAGNLSSAYAAALHSGRLAERGGVPWAVLNAPYEIDNDEVDRLRAQWVDSSTRSTGAPAVTSGGFTLETLSISPVEMALLEQRDFDETRIAIALGVQPYQVGLKQGGGGLVYQNVSMIFDYHWRSTLRPHTRKIAQALKNWALPAGQTLHFNPDEYVRPGIDDRAETYVKLHGIEDDTGRVITASEIRDAEDMQAKEDTPSHASVPGETMYG